MKMKLLLALVVLILLLSGVTYGGWRLYQGHLSSDLRRTLIAAADPTASDTDLHAYLRRARLQVRTERDAEIFGKIATAVQLNDTVRKQVLLNAQRMDNFATRDLNENSACRQMLRLEVKEVPPRAQVLREQCKNSKPQRRQNWNQNRYNKLFTRRTWIEREICSGIFAMSLGSHQLRINRTTLQENRQRCRGPGVAMANHANTRTTQLYDRWRDEMSLDEVERILI